MSEKSVSKPASSDALGKCRDSGVEDDRKLRISVFDNSQVIVATLDRSFRFLYANQALTQTRGLTPSDVIGKTVAEAIPDVWPTMQPLLQRVLKGEAVTHLSFNVRLNSATNEARNWIINFNPIFDEEKAVGIAMLTTDVTSIRISERALRLRADIFAMLSPTNRAVSESRTADELFQHVCDIAVDTGRFAFAWIGVPDGNVVRGAASSGVDKGFIIEAALSLDRQSDRSRGPLAQALLTGKFTVENDFLASTPTAPWHELAQRVGFASCAAFPIRQGDNVAAALAVYSNEKNYFSDEMVNVLNEITPTVSFALQRFAQEELQRRGEEDLSQRDRAIAAISQGIVITDPRLPDNPIVYAGPSFERLTGYSLDESIGRNCRFLQGPNTNPRAVEELRAAIREGKSRTVEILNYRKDGSTFWNNLSVSPVFDEAGVVINFVGVQVDVSERRELEQQLFQSQKMEAVGTLAAGIAHDFNNMLLVIRGYNDLVAKRVTEDDLKEIALRIDTAVQQAADVTHRLLDFSRQQILQSEPTDLNALINENMWLWQRMLGDDIVLVAELDPALEAAVIDHGQIERAIVNLVANARDAMPSGGTLTMRTALVDLDEEYAAAHEGVTAGPHALGEITDTGTGIDEVTQSRIFEPFFTTKPIGTGLGFASVYGIVKQCGGHIQVTSRLGAGTTFKLYFPVSDAPRPPLTSRRVSERTREGVETVLVVEDLHEARELLVASLEGYGYRVLQAANGEEALSVAKSFDATIDVLLTDLAMPQMNGRDLAQRLLDERPSLKVIFTSGYPSNNIVHEEIFVSRSAFVEKPYLLDDMALVVRQILN